MEPHAGSWTIPGTNIPLPDYGITEAIGDIFGQSRNAQGGSQLRQGTVLNVGNVPYYNTPSGPTVQTATTGGGGYTQPSGGGGDTGGLPVFQRGTNTGYIQNGMRWNGVQWESMGGSGGGIDPYRQQQEGLINSQFGSYFSNLDRQLGLLPQEEQSLGQQVQNLYGTQQGDINTQQQELQGQIAQGQTQAGERKATSLRDLEGNMRNSLFAANQYLGTRGAGSSSAANMYSFALSKAANRQRGGILNQFNSTLAQLDQKQIDIKNSVGQQMNELTNWKNNQLLQVTSYINEKRNQLQNMVAQGQIDQGTALRELNTNIYNQAQARLSQIDQQTSSFGQALQSWALQRASQLNDFKLKLSNNAQFSIPEVMQSEFNIMPQGTIGGGQNPLYGYYGTQKKTDQYGRPLTI